MAAEVDARRDRDARGLRARRGRTPGCRRRSASCRRRRRSRRSASPECRSPARAAPAPGNRGASRNARRRSSSIASVSGRKQASAARCDTRRRRDVEILRELLEVAHVALGRDDPAQPPPGHVEVLGEARHDEESSACAPASVERRLRLAVVGEAEIDLVDDEPPAQRAHGRGDPAQLVRRRPACRSDSTATRSARRACAASSAASISSAESW